MSEGKAASSRAQWLAPLIVLVLGVLAYSNSLDGPFIFDDRPAIIDNPQIRSLNPFRIAAVSRTTIRGRPALIFSFAANYAMGRLRVEGYHVTNVAIHLLSGLFVYGIVRRTLLQPRVWGERFVHSATWLGAAVAAVWIVHPLDTQSVTYIVQRAESLGGMFMLASLYCLIRSATGSGWWGLGAVVASALGMASKEMVAVLPVVAIVYDRTFLAGTFARAVRLRWKIYLGMAAGLGFIFYSLHEQQWGEMAGTELGVSSLEYARTELNVIARYFSLAFWPGNLCLDYYDWPIARHWADVSIGGWAVLVGAVGGLVAVKFKPWLGFLAVWVMAILAPTSSFLPIKQEAAAEQRMYLPLVAIVALVVVGAWALASRWKAGRWVIAIAGVAVVVAFSWLTAARNEQYGSAIDIWTDTVTKRPNNARAHGNLGEMWAQASLDFPAGSADAREAEQAAADQFRVALELEPRVLGMVFALGESLVRLGDEMGAEKLYTEQLPLYPNDAADLLVERGALRARRGDLDEAKDDFTAAIAAKPGDVEGHYFLGVVYQEEGDMEGAVGEFRKVILISPGYKDAQRRLETIDGKLK